MRSFPRCRWRLGGTGRPLGLASATPHDHGSQHRYHGSEQGAGEDEDRNREAALKAEEPDLCVVVVLCDEHDQCRDPDHEENETQRERCRLVERTRCVRYVVNDGLLGAAALIIAHQSHVRRRSSRLCWTRFRHPIRSGNMPNVFTKIIEGEVPGSFVWRDAECVAFMSINPLRRGHTLVVPRMEVDHWIDAPDGVRDYIFGVAQTIGQAIQAAYNPHRVGLMIAGLEVPHLHIHLVPMQDVHDLDFANAAVSVERSDLEAAAELIRVELRSMGAEGVSD